MIPGKKYTLKFKKQTDFGVYLTDGETEILLPKKEVPDKFGSDQELEVFVYLDSKDRPIATRRTPLIELDKLAPLTVKESGKIGLFLDWGLEKDLFLPFRETSGSPKVGDEILVRMYLDKSGRLCASQRRLYDKLSKNPPYSVGEEVDARVYEFGHDFGTFVAIDDKYSAMIPKHEDRSMLRIGDVITVRITAIKEDGKCDVTMRQSVNIQMDADSEKLYEIIESYAGVLPFSEKASPEVIYRETGLSKAAFKRAIGRLYKERKITLEGGKIRKA